jgi:hypothetical protein
LPREHAQFAILQRSHYCDQKPSKVPERLFGLFEQDHSTHAIKDLNSLLKDWVFEQEIKKNKKTIAKTSTIHFDSQSTNGIRSREKSEK